jgi:hypothetical protein
MTVEVAEGKTYTVQRVVDDGAYYRALWALERVAAAAESLAHGTNFIAGYREDELRRIATELRDLARLELIEG